MKILMGFQFTIRSAVKSNITSWCNQNLSRRALNALTELASTSEFGKLFHILTICAVKNVSVNRSEKYDLEVYNCFLLY